MGKTTKKSVLEMHFKWYLEELKTAGYVKEWLPQPKTYVLFNRATYIHEKKLKTKIKEIESVIPGLSQHVYTPDFKVFWAKKAHCVFYTTFYDRVKALSEFFTLKALTIVNRCALKKVLSKR